jgi:hypothetical protein
MMTASSNRACPRLTLLAVAAALTCAFSTALGEDWPTFKPGLWEFDRTIEGMAPAPKKVSRKQCVDPTADQKTQRGRLTAAGCEFSPIVRTGTTYRYSATCRIAGETTSSSSVLEFQSAEAYKLVVDSTTAGQKSHEVLIARRLGDCPK